MRVPTLALLAVLASCGGRVEPAPTCAIEPPPWNFVAPDARELCAGGSCQVCNSLADACDACPGATLFACQGGPMRARDLVGCAEVGSGANLVTFACCP